MRIFELWSLSRCRRVCAAYLKNLHSPANGRNNNEFKKNSTNKQ